MPAATVLPILIPLVVKAVATFFPQLAPFLMPIEFLLGKLAPKPPGFDAGPAFESTGGRTQQIRQAITPRRVLYGEQRVSGPLLFARSTEDNKMLHLVIALASHECEAIDDVVFDDTLIHSTDLDGDGFVARGIYENKVRIKKHLGATDQAADADLVADVTEWTNNHNLNEIAYLYIRLEADQDLYPTGIPGISAWVKGKKILDTRDSVTRWSPNPALCLRDFLTDTKFGLAAAASEIDETVVDAAAKICDEMVDTEDLAVTVASVDASGNTLDIRGNPPLVLQTGDRVQVTTTGNLPAGIVAVTDYFVIVSQRQDFGQIKLATTYANALAGTEITITDDGSGTHTVTKNAEPRYTANGFFASDQTPAQTITDLLSSMAGRVANSGGTWRMRAGAWVAPTITFDEGDMRGPLGVQTRHQRRQRFNAVRGVYASPINAGIPTDYPPVTNATYLAADNGERLWADRNLAYTSRPHTAQRLAKIELERHRQEMSLSYPVNLTGLQLEVGDTANIDNTRMGFTGKDFEVVTWGLVVEEDDDDAPLLGINLGLRETASAVFDWNSGEETTVDPAPNTNLPDGLRSDPPASLTLQSGTAALFLAGDGTVVSRIRVTWTAPADAFVTEYEVQWRNATASENYTTAAVMNASTTEAFIGPARDGDSYDVRVRSTNRWGVRSSFLEVVGHVVIGKTAPPADVPTLFIDGNIITWTYPTPPADFDGFRIKHNAGTNTFWANATAAHEGLVTVTQFDISRLALGTRTILVKAVDTSGNESTNAAILVRGLGDPLSENIVETTDLKALDWPDSFTNGSLDGSGDLIADSTGSLFWNGIDATPMWTGDHLTFWTDTYKQMVHDYKFTPLASWTGGQLLVDHTVVAESWMFEYKIDGSSLMWRGDDTALFWTGDAILFWDTNDAFAPWPGALSPLLRQAYNLRLTVEAGAIQGKVSQYDIKADMPDVTERLDDVAIAAGGTRLPITKTYLEIKNVLLTIQDDGGSAISARAVDKSLAGPLIKTADAAGAAVSGTIDARVQGF